MRNFQKELDEITAGLKERPALALHGCCAPCSSYVLEYLTRFFEITLFYSNPNIHPRGEYERRFSEQKRICGVFGVHVVECGYDQNAFFDAVRGLENEPEGGARCAKCFEQRLGETAKAASERGITLLCTTLTVSPHKDAPLINGIGERVAERYGMRWLPGDFKKRGGYQRSIELCREYNVYRQDYCGCVYSLEKTEVQRRLFSLMDVKFRDFTAPLIPDVEKSRVIGVRSPDVRALAREISGTPLEAEFLDSLPHFYVEENNLHSVLLTRIKDFSALLGRVNRFLPYVDNWATCDILRPAAFKKRPPELYDSVKAWLRSDRPYTVRFGMGTLMAYYLDDGFLPEQPELVARAVTDEYYVKMMAAWYFATALAKQYDTAVRFLEDRTLDKWTHNKAIQKAVESFRVSDERKDYIKTLRIK